MWLSRSSCGSDERRHRLEQRLRPRAEQRLDLQHVGVRGGRLAAEGRRRRRALRRAYETSGSSAFTSGMYSMRPSGMSTTAKCLRDRRRAHLHRGASDPETIAESDTASPPARADERDVGLRQVGARQSDVRRRSPRRRRQQQSSTCAPTPRRSPALPTIARTPDTPCRPIEPSEWTRRSPSIEAGHTDARVATSPAAKCSASAAVSELGDGAADEHEGVELELLTRRLGLLEVLRACG